jgi:hypothetical protein
MGMGLYDLAGRVATAGDELGDAAVRLGTLDPGAGAFGADANGRLGELGRALHGQVAGALAVRSRESAATSSRLVELAVTLRAAASSYADVEQAAHHRGREAR